VVGFEADMGVYVGGISSGGSSVGMVKWQQHDWALSLSAG